MVTRNVKRSRPGAVAMRARSALVALVVLATLAGCTGDGDPSTTPTATPTATPSPEPTPTPTATPEVTPSPQPEPQPRKMVLNQTFDFSTEGDPTGQSPKTRTSDAVPAGYGSVVVNITIVRTNTAPTTLPVSGTINSPKVRVLDPNGEEKLAESTEGAVRSETFPATPGVWTVRFEGAGTLKATVTLTALG